MTGINAWKKPNHSPQTSAIFHEKRFVVNPLQIETEKASMERPMAIKSNSTKLIIIDFQTAKLVLFKKAFYLCDEKYDSL